MTDLPHRSGAPDSLLSARQAQCSLRSHGLRVIATIRPKVGAKKSDVDCAAGSDFGGGADSVV